MPLADLIGPAGALVLALGILALFYTGRILPRNVVPREDYDAIVQIHAAYVEMFGKSVDAIRELTTDLRAERAKRGRP